VAYKTQNGQQTLCLRIYNRGARMSDNEQSQQREENANIDLKEKMLKQIFVYGSLLEEK